MLKKNILAVAIIVSGLALSAGAFAQSYIGATAGSARADIDCAGASSCKKSDTAFKVFGGYDISPMFAVEAGFFSLGTASASYSGASGKFEARGIEVSGLIKTPAMKGFIGYGKLGVAAIKAETTVKVGADSGLLSKNSNQAVYGFGLMYQLNNDIRLRTEIERRNVKAANFDGSSATVINFSIGLQAAF